MASTPPPIEQRQSVSGPGRDHAWSLAVINQLALPGFGTYMAGRKTSGIVQMLLSLMGVVSGAAFLFFAISRRADWLNPPDDPDLLLANFEAWKPWLLLGAGGIVVYLIAWCWALATSARVVRRNSDSNRA
ncbi:MAG TPA: hypothetical protein DCY13_06850 [Verrucomicrobiales bacterium]|nr:hypothetical protein [Verrucomicrobiales bacterium]